MKKIFNYLFNKGNLRVIYLPVKKIDMKTKDSIENSIKDLNVGNTAAIMIAINTGLPNTNHSLVYADQIGETLLKKTKEIGGDTKLITYAEDSCLGVGFHLL